MNRRDKIIVLAIGAFLAVLFVYLGANSLVFKPLERAAQRRASLEEDIRRQTQLNARLPALHARLNKFAAATLSKNETQAAEEVRARLAGLLVSAGLSSEKWKLTPSAVSALPGTRAKEKDKRLGWAINARGAPEQVVNFLYLLQSEPYLHRLDNLKLTPAKAELTLDVTFQTLVLADRKDQPLPATMPATRPAAIGDGAQMYALVSQRDIFRPYIPRKAPPPAPPAPQAHQPSPVEPSQPPPPNAPSMDGARVVSLSSWPEPEVLLNDNGRMQPFKIGDSLGQGRIVMIDYRPLPDPQNPELLIESRAILQIGQEYWAVDRGRTLGQRHRLSAESLPAELAHPTTQPQDVQEQRDGSAGVQ